jgi:formylglycine-generating enzyme required for sulfatase activity
MGQAYLDFELEIGKINAVHEIPVTVINSPAGEAKGIMNFPFSEIELENRLLALQNAVLRSSGQFRVNQNEEEKIVQDFGQKLFESLFTGDIRSLYYESQRLVKQQNRGMRIKLRIRSSWLSVVPWEYLYDKRSGEYVCLSRNTPLVRYLEISQPVRPLQVTLPLRILGMIANPHDSGSINSSLEKHRLETALSSLLDQGLVELSWLDGYTWRDLQKAMRHSSWNIFHFIGHGGYDSIRDEGLLIFGDENNSAQPLHAMQIGRLLADNQSLHLVILNSCEGARGSKSDLFSSTSATLIQRGVPAVLALQYQITDKAAIELTRTFYECIADNMPVDAAVAEARKAISFTAANSLEWGTPVLHMRTPDGNIFNITQLNTTASVVVDKTKNNASKKMRKFSPINFDWVPIPEGEFIMGSDKTKDTYAQEVEFPQHQVFLQQFWISRVPVTNQQYKQFIDAAGYKPPSYWENGEIPKGKELHPIVYISWRDAQFFCDWANVRLPSEAEWEKAARGGDGRIYPWGDTPPHRGVCNFSNTDGTTPVGMYKQGVSPFGVLDMSGNVWEWTGSLWGSNANRSDFLYPYNSLDGREDLNAADNVGRIMRGGGYTYYSHMVRCAVRKFAHALSVYNDVGFRVVALTD